MKVYIMTHKYHDYGYVALMLNPLDDYILLGEFELPEGVVIPSHTDARKAYREHLESQKEARIAELKRQIEELEGAA